MKVLSSRSLFLICTVTIFLLMACEKEVEDSIPQATVVNKFIWNNLKTYYFWTDNIPNLTNPDFQKKDSLNKFLNTYADPEMLFNDLLYQKGQVDKWSFIEADYKEIDNWISGISYSMGFDFRLYTFSNSDNMFGVVRYVLKGSPAYLAGIKRGDFFIKVNNNNITRANYEELLYPTETNKTFTFSMATLTNNTISQSDKSYTMTAIEIHENPILLDTVYTIGGSKVGYLVYNGFTAGDDKIKLSYDVELNKVFGDFKSSGIQKLIIDLRYNGGGSIQTSAYLASMIYSTDASKVFCKKQYNALLQSELSREYGANGFNIYFTNKINKTANTPETPINSLNFNQLYVITSSGTASASELLVNGLKPYMTVKMIGSNTTGKNVGSMTIKDEDSNGTINPNNKWAMQPIILKIANSLNFSDYANGLSPDITKVEEISNMLPFGDQNEALLKVALDDIRGFKSATTEPKLTFNPFGSRKDFMRFGNEMYDTKNPFSSLNLDK